MICTALTVNIGSSQVPGTFNQLARHSCTVQIQTVHKTNDSLLVKLLCSAPSPYSCCLWFNWTFCFQNWSNRILHIKCRSGVRFNDVVELRRINWTTLASQLRTDWNNRYMVQLLFAIHYRNWVFSTNSSLLIPISLKP